MVGKGEEIPLFCPKSFLLLLFSYCSGHCAEYFKSWLDLIMEDYLNESYRDFIGLK